MCLPLFIYKLPIPSSFYHSLSDLMLLIVKSQWIPKLQFEHKQIPFAKYDTPSLQHLFKKITYSLNQLSPEKKKQMGIQILFTHHTLKEICLIASKHLQRKKIKVYTSLEKTAEEPSSIFHLNRTELKMGQISFQNGMGSRLEHAKEHAEKISSYAKNHNVHVVYSTTLGLHRDLASSILGQCGVLTPPSTKALKLWTRFFSENSSDRLLHICYSRGAIETDNALKQLRKSLQKRIIVINIAGAHFIPAHRAHRVVNLAIEKDPIVQIATNRHLLRSEETRILPPHNDEEDLHNLHGSSYKKALLEMIDCYLRTNDIEEKN